ncbi:SDR family NAD(P)-dependent oxidoreductase [Salmonella enterica subsp. enterica]|nr:SDR family NAD(P)-dependent oxidoreductase [Salmonella enterica subsp. enterica]
MGFATAKLFAETALKWSLSTPMAKLRSRSCGHRAKVISVMANVADEVQVQAAIEQIMAKYGRVDVPVNNAGISR